MQAVILAAGKGTRMRPLTDTCPKPMIKLNNRPLLAYIVDNLIAVGITNIVIVVGYLGEQIVEYFSDYKNTNIKFVTQEKREGTAKSIGTAKPYVNGDFIVINGDALFEKEMISKMISIHEEGELNILGKRVEDARPYGVLVLDGNNIIDIIEKPENPPSNLINAGFYIFPPEIFEAINKTGLSQRGEYEITDSIKLLIDEGVVARAIEYEGDWIDVSKPEDILRATDWVNSKTSLN